MKPFDLEKALAGEPISFNEEKCYVHASKSSEGYFLLEFVNTGKVRMVKMSHLERYGQEWKEPRPTVTLTLPCPLKEPQPNMWYITSIFTVTQSTYSENSDKERTVSNWILEKGLYFATKEDAQIWLDTLQNNRK